MFEERMVLMTFSGNWKVVKDLSLIKSGVTVHANDNVFFVYNHDLCKNVKISFGDFVSDSYKYRNELLYAMLAKVNGLSIKENLYLDSKACEAIDQICESNRLLY